MDFVFTSEQNELRDTIRDFFGKHIAAVRERPPGSLDRPLWNRLTAELGLTALAIPEEYGGFGATLVEVGIALEESGRVLACLPYLSTVVAAAALQPSFSTVDSSGAAVGRLLARFADGSSIATLAVAEPGLAWGADWYGTTARREGTRYVLSGVKEHILDGDVADVAIVVAVCEGELGLFAVSSTDARPEPMTTLDQTRPVARWVFDDSPGARVSPVGDGGAAVTRAVDLLHAALALEAVGVASGSLELTIAYLKARQQFGVPLATFQALRHRVADLAVSLDAVTSSAWYAIRLISPSVGSSLAAVPGSESSVDDEFAVAAPLAKLVASDAAYAVTADSIQLHGGIGFTWEHDAHRFFKRATVVRQTHGDPPSLRRIIAARAGL